VDVEALERFATKQYTTTTTATTVALVLIFFHVCIVIVLQGLRQCYQFFQIEVVGTSTVLTHVEMVVKFGPFFESQLGLVVPSVVSDEQHSTWFEASS
jgi:hypothetical protein